jgi:hypothetical protein
MFSYHYCQQVPCAHKMYDTRVWLQNIKQILIRIFQYANDYVVLPYLISMGYNFKFEFSLLNFFWGQSKIYFGTIKLNQIFLTSGTFN